MINKSLIITGPSGVGKGTLISYLLLKIPQLSLTLSFTTRKPRANQIQGVHYYFVTKQQFKKQRQQNKFLQQTTIYGNSYASSKQHYNRLINSNLIPVFDVNAMGVLSLKNTLKQFSSCQCLCLMPPNWKVLQDRLRNRRSQSEQAINKRLQQNKKQIQFLKEIGSNAELYYVKNYQYQMTGYAVRLWIKQKFNNLNI